MSFLFIPLYVCIFLLIWWNSVLLKYFFLMESCFFKVEGHSCLTSFFRFSSLVLFIYLFLLNVKPYCLLQYCCILLTWRTCFASCMLACFFCFYHEGFSHFLSFLNDLFLVPFKKGDLSFCLMIFYFFLFLISELDLKGSRVCFCCFF